MLSANMTLLRVSRAVHFRRDTESVLTMRFDSTVYHRQSVRLPGYDYTSLGAYLVGLVSWQRECVFGEVVAGEMRLSKIGLMAQHEWERLPRRFPYLELDIFTIMPNHIHGILVVVGNAPHVDVPAGGQPKSLIPVTSDILLNPWLTRVAPGSLGAIVRAFKSSVTLRYNRRFSSSGVNLWQRNYYDRIIRNEEELGRIRLYIQHNPKH